MNSIGDAIASVRERVRWWRAQRYGTHPECEECGRDADYYTTDRGYLCWPCEDRLMRRVPVAAVRDLRPADYLEADPGWDA